MTPSLPWLWLIGFGLAACSGPVALPRVAPAVARAPVARNEATRSVKAAPPAPLPAPLADQDENDQHFVENAQRAIAEYRAFIARAGTKKEFAPAVETSRERIQDLLHEIVWVQAGQRQRAAE